MKIDVSSFSAPCPCGREHKIHVKDILIEAGAINKIPELLTEIFTGKPEEICIICDDNTYSAAGVQVEDKVKGCKVIVLPSKGLHADNHGVKLAEEKLENHIKLILAVGSGTIHDLSRYLANKRGIPFVSVPTAASVDGFVSTVAAMTWNGFKKTFPAVSPILVVADSTIFSKAPYRLTASGISDLLGKYTALVDWEVAHLVTDEYICNRVCDLELTALNEVCSCLEDLRGDVSEEARLKAYEQLMYALLLSGIAMQMVGNSRPASGAEHHISHLWEMDVINHPLDAYHGEKVSIGLMIAAETYHTMKEAIRNGQYEMISYNGLDYLNLKESFGPKGLYEGMLEENTPDPLEQIDVMEFERILPQIADILDKLPSVDRIDELLTKGGCVKYVHEIGLDEHIIPKTICLSPYVRNRLTFMRLTKLIQLF
ncbi:sn-glycerol-1-phosphate dehydrogenase [Anaerocolumna sp. MB42-C2]|uniref:sn-glycerol-1-phosphate dehydrogenase n=1 Tax=Anaerocolumna sp. MB42-C2 TaxID=3070997 RepID=UPI0027DF92DA|nr:sn-glycerol-1-phosphate dehydrogenase [Anaerocolumna sp. MB42-C2]WMJ88346.1 sn-glycerol-1-phosphate dehydrogenase [Anaerocolumna sp. MB42-C2]